MKRELFFCDRCGKEIEQYGHPWLHFKKMRRCSPLEAWLGDYKHFDWMLCDDCANELLAWLKEKKE